MLNYLLHHLLEQSAKKYPDKAAVVFNDASLTYNELDKKSSDLSTKLIQLGVKKGDRVGIMLPKSIEAIIALFGILKTGAIYVPIDPASPNSRSAYIIKHCEIECLITSSRHALMLFSDTGEILPVKKAIVTDKDGSALNGLNIPVKCLSWSEISFGKLTDFRPVEMSDGSPAYILHTSGSTGNPKGVVISHLNALTFVNMAAEFFSISSEDRFCNQAPLHFDLSVFDIFVAVKCGATVVLLPELLSLFPLKLAEFIAQKRISIWNSVSSVLAMLTDKGMLDRFSFDSLRIVHFSGDIMPVKYLRKLIKHMSTASFYNIYGQTEANSSMFYPIQIIPDSVSWKIPIGKSFPNFEVFAMSDTQEIISYPEEEGELYISSSTVALGYWNTQQMTDEKFTPDPRYPSTKKVVYRTGDLVRLDANGDYIFVGRKDHMVKSRGYRIELGEIEIVLLNHAKIRTAVAIPIPDELIGNRIAAVIVPIGKGIIENEEVISHCSAFLPKYMIPDIIEFRESVPMTSTGKVDRKNLTEDLSKRVTSDNN
jgi:amino acid adenylation domain-containing protein